MIAVETATQKKSADRTESFPLAAESTVGAVVIGRNEGDRLRQCLESLLRSVRHVVYVDSGSTDRSCELAEQMGVQVVPLDLSIPFTAARARNEGVDALVQQHAGIKFVQVVDGDCAIADGWISRAIETLTSNEDAAIVCGRRRELYPHVTKYNRMCDMEWDGPEGNVKSCGGDALIRIRAFHEIRGFNSNLIAGEEPEMCVRLRQNGWDIMRINHNMTWHDAAMARFGQWWKRAVRAGHAYAEGYAMHGGTPEAFRRREVRSIVFWGGVVPIAAFVAAAPTLGLSLLAALLGYIRLCRRIRAQRQSDGDSRQNAQMYARFTVLGKLPQFLGLMKFRLNRLRRKQSTLIEYK